MRKIYEEHNQQQVIVSLFTLFFLYTTKVVYKKRELRKNHSEIIRCYFSDTPDKLPSVTKNVTPMNLGCKQQHAALAADKACIHPPQEI